MDMVIEVGGETRRHLKSFAQLQELCKVNSARAEGARAPPHVGCILGARGPPLQQRTSAWLQYLWGQQLHLGGGFIRRNEGRLNCPAESPWGLPLSSPPVPRGEDAATDALKTPVEVPQPGTRG